MGCNISGLQEDVSYVSKMFRSLEKLMCRTADLNMEQKDYEDEGLPSGWDNTYQLKEKLFQQFQQGKDYDDNKNSGVATKVAIKSY
uniref:Uncharacterized protein n=1 Tax=Lactuca sativa TaxID=4236 RepID=A0A9R1VBE8_LACSA|nr:hypothetical protein LSAT_V11C600315210 [Lactuca sativa]